ncbi:NAD kinase [Winogradskyella aurantiaca]|uniref:NAD kinase n=1 Tax=Winogradskyella aurantiaca TaxID=2219558 RepID=UPI000E1C7D3D|nr:NAD kinase [Winogradskyella aurantiaca]
MKVAIYGQIQNDLNTHTFHSLVSILKSYDVTVLVEQNFYNLMSADEPFETYKELDSSYSLLISIGGDGTILRAVTLIRNSGIPIVGINTGRLGFLATISLDQFETSIEQLLNGNYQLSKRRLLSVSTSIPNKDIEHTNFALNEITVSRKNTTSMITVETHLNSEYLTSYWADGLILSTPTGSTGYSLSCGGPVITPESKNFVLTPIAPHNLNARPLVINDDTIVKLKVTGREKEYLISLDSRIVTLPNVCVVTVKKAEFYINLVELEDKSFLKTIRKKLLWGEDQRN